MTFDDGWSHRQTSKTRRFPHGLCGQFYISVAQQALRVRRCFGQVPLFATLWTVARWAPLSMGFSVQEYWRGLSCSSAGDLPGQGSNLHLPHCRQILYWLSHQGSPHMQSESEVTQSCLALSNPVDCSLPGSSVHGIFQARVPDWGATAFS